MNPLFTKIDSENTLHRLRPLSNAELQRLREEFIIETTHNSNAIEGIRYHPRNGLISGSITITEKPLREHLDIIGLKMPLLYHRSCLPKYAAHRRHDQAIHSFGLNERQKTAVSKRPRPHLRSTPYPTSALSRTGHQSTASTVCPSERRKHILEAIALLHLNSSLFISFIDGNERGGCST